MTVPARGGWEASPRTGRVGAILVPEPFEYILYRNA